MRLIIIVLKENNKIMALLPVRDVENLILDQLDIPGLVALAQVNRHYRSLVKTHPVYLQAKIISYESVDVYHRHNMAAQSGSFVIYSFFTSRMPSHYADREAAFRHACGAGRIPLAQLISSKQPSLLQSNMISSLIYHCIKRNQLVSLRWLVGFPGQDPPADYFRYACSYYQDRVAMAQFLYEVFHLTLDHVTNELMVETCNYGTIESVWWLHQLKPSWVLVGPENTQLLYGEITPEKKAKLIWLWQQGKFVTLAHLQSYYSYFSRWEDIELLRLLSVTLQTTLSERDYNYFYQACQQNQAELAQLHWRITGGAPRKYLELALMKAQLDGTISQKQWLFDLWEK